jgi:hypothetical protein
LCFVFFLSILVIHFFISSSCWDPTIVINYIMHFVW